MTLNAQTLAAVLGTRPFRYFDVLDSTNDLAQDWLRAGAPGGAVVIADEQRKGRGRKGRLWHTPPGVALAISVVLHPPQEALHQVSMLGALAIAELLDSLGAQDVGIKWPNDVQLNGRKVCGVLPEVVWQGEHLLGVVLGMGLNVRMGFSGTELEPTAISIEPALGRMVERADLIARLLTLVDAWAEKLASPLVFEAWQARLNTLGRAVIVDDEPGSPLRGTAEAVEPDGTLLLRLADGSVRRVLAGDLSFGDPNG